MVIYRDPTIECHCLETLCLDICATYVTVVFLFVKYYGYGMDMYMYNQKKGKISFARPA